MSVIRTRILPLVLLSTCHMAWAGGEQCVVADSSTIIGGNESTAELQHIDPWRLSAVSAVGVGAFAIGHGWLNTLWWKGEPTSFHWNVEQDWTYALGADKVGHAYFTSMATTALAGTFRWSGMDSASAIWTGAGVALLYQTYNEVRDGFSVKYGFSPGDMVANLLGAALPVAQYYAPSLKNVTFQISFYPSEPFRQGMYGAIIDDYESTTHWLSLDVYEMLPQLHQSWYPKWVNLAVGHSVRGLVGSATPQHVFVLSLDWNLKRLPFLPDWLRSAFEYLHMYHLPAPAVEITPNMRWVGLRY